MSNLTKHSIIHLSKVMFLFSCLLTSMITFNDMIFHLKTTASFYSFCTLCKLYKLNYIIVNRENIYFLELYFPYHSSDLLISWISLYRFLQIYRFLSYILCFQINDFVLAVTFDIKWKWNTVGISLSFYIKCHATKSSKVLNAIIRSHTTKSSKVLNALEVTQRRVRRYLML